MNILIVDDEPKTVAYLAKGLSENGFQVESATDGESGLALALAGNHAMIVLDVMLPGLDGWSILERIRSARRVVPVLFLTARDAVPDRVRGLELGADDYLVKPFAFSELLARIRTLLRRGGGRGEVIRIADLEIDCLQIRVHRAGRLLDLTPKEYALLLQFALRPREVLSRRFLAEAVWGITFDSDTNIVDVHVRRLRAKMDDPFDKKLIRTVRGMGYVLEGS